MSYNSDLRSGAISVSWPLSPQMDELHYVRVAWLTLFSDLGLILVPINKNIVTGVDLGTMP